MMLRQIEIARGYVLRNDNGVQQPFTVRQVALDAVELRYDCSGKTILLRVDRMAGNEVLEAIERKTGCLAKIDYAQSRLTWSGMRR
jgi:hypothetical protein